jgi:hypothetical protein
LEKDNSFAPGRCCVLLLVNYSHTRLPEIDLGILTDISFSISVIEIVDRQALCVCLGRDGHEGIRIKHR